jgi:hypothetical protein
MEGTEGTEGREGRVGVLALSGEVRGGLRLSGFR